MAEIVLDASAILTFLQGEKGADIVEQSLPPQSMKYNKSSRPLTSASLKLARTTQLPMGSYELQPGRPGFRLGTGVALR